LAFGSPDALGDVATDQFGTSLTFASPFLAAAFWARWRRPLLLGAWLSTAATLAVLLVYFNNGFVQVNFQRYTLDALPVLMLLVALGARRFPSRTLWIGLVVYSVCLNLLTLLVVPVWQLLQAAP